MITNNRGTTEEGYIKKYPWLSRECIECGKVFSWKFQGKKRTDKRCSECIKKEEKKREKGKVKKKRSTGYGGKLYMKIITINLSEPHIKALQVLQDIGLYPSRSEAIRVAIRDFLQKELGFAQNIERFDQPPLSNKSSIEDRKREISRLIRKLEKDQRVETASTY